MTKETTESDGLSALDWVVIVAATLALVLLTVWLVQGQPPLRRRPAEPVES